LENVVTYHRGQAQLTLSLVQENSALIKRNYDAAFGGNRELAKQNTEDAFRNRLAIVGNLTAAAAATATAAVTADFKDAMLNEVKTDFLDHRSKLNEKVLRMTEQFVAVNKQLIEINQSIMDTNEEIVAYNVAAIAENTLLINNGLPIASASLASNAAIITANGRSWEAPRTQHSPAFVRVAAEKIDLVYARARQNKARIVRLFDDTQKNRVAITVTSEQIAERRKRIEQNRANIVSNQNRLATFLTTLWGGT
jgi:hypothetical protein